MAQPKWKVLADELALECAARRPGEGAPTVRQLIADRRGSQSTISEAYDELVRRGVVRAKHGVGYIVLPRRSATLRLVRQAGPAGSASGNYPAQFSDWEVPAPLVLVSQTVVEPSASTAIKLGLPADNLMVLCSTHHAVVDASDDADSNVLLVRTIWQPSTGQHEQTGAAREQVQYRPATDAEAETLGLPYNEPVVEIEQVLSDISGSPVELRHMVAPASYTKLVAENLLLPLTGSA